MLIYFMTSIRFDLCRALKKCFRHPKNEFSWEIFIANTSIFANFDFTIFLFDSERSDTIERRAKTKRPSDRRYFSKHFCFFSVSLFIFFPSLSRRFDRSLSTVKSKLVIQCLTWLSSTWTFNVEVRDMITQPRRKVDNYSVYGSNSFFA